MILSSFEKTYYFNEPDERCSRHFFYHVKQMQVAGIDKCQP